MIYQALYRKYRPKTFNEVCGQQVIVQTLKNTIKNNKLSHAYLFIGPRGTGKTSIAKIFAKSINCLNPIDGCSCENCDICKISNNNENVDIIEMDAASNNGVDEIREIKNHVSLMPTFSKYKIYIIDEVHMLSSGAFNALLKTLEEPPKHVIFILATTEPQKVPLTILSRCQSFEFKSIFKNDMKCKLQEICDKEKINIDDDSINQICLDSNGGLRDAISELDQLNSFTNGNINIDSVILLNGRISNNDIVDLLQNIHKNDISSLFNMSDDFYENGKDFTLICNDIITFLKDSLVQYQIENENEIVSLFGKEKVIKIIYEITDFINYTRNLKNKKIYFDLMLIKICDLMKTNNSTIVNLNNIEVENKVPTKKEDENINNKNESTLNNNYLKLMDIRLNNILANADKNSLNETLSLYSNLESSLENLEERKIFNLLQDCSIKAASKNGIIITSSNNNILFELYESLLDTEKLFNNKLKRDIKICFYDENLWNDKRKYYIEKIHKKEKIDLLDESEIYNNIYKNNKEIDEFSSLLEIGE